MKSSAHRSTFFATVVSLVVACAAFAQSSVPALINYQGRMLDAQGVPVATADYELHFTLYSTLTGGTPVWGPQIFDGATGQGHGAKVPAVQGYFNIILGPVDIDGAAIADAFNAPDRYLEIQIGSDTPIAPRQRILSAPFALMAAHVADGSITAAKIATGAVGSVQLANGAIGSVQLANASVGSAQIANGAVGAAQLAAGAFAFVPRAVQVFTSSGTWIKPAGVSTVYVKVIGRGGHGGASGNTSLPFGGGGGGGYAEGPIAVAGNVTITIGAINSFAGVTTIQATSGSDASDQTGGAGGVGSGGAINISGGPGQSVSTTTNGTGGMGGGTAMGAGGAGAGLNNGVSYSAETNGASFGGGGGGATNVNHNGGAGDPGAVIIYY